MKIGSRTPWGRADSVTQLIPGIWFVSTPGHGGLKLSPTLNKRVPDGARRKGGWYEEDCEYYIPLAVFPEIRRETTEAQIVRGLATWCEDALYALVSAGVVSLTDEARIVLANHEAERRRLAQAKANGLPIRCSALRTGDGRIHVLFWSEGASEAVGYYMDRETYKAIPLLQTATPDDYRQHGKLDPAPATFDHSGGRQAKAS